MSSTTTFSVLKLAVLTAALAFQGAAFAAGPADAASGGTVQGVAASAPTDAQHSHRAGKMHRQHRHHRDIAMWVPGYGPVNTALMQSLALSDGQTQALKDAQAAQKELRSDRRASMKAAKTARLAGLESGKLDPKAAFDQAEKLQQQSADQRRQVGQKWMAVWNSLDQTQQQKVSAYFKDRAQKRADHVKKHERSSSAPAADKTKS